MKPLLYSILIIALLLISCEKKIDCSLYDKEAIPNDLTEALDHLDCFMNKEYKQKFKEIPENELIGTVHFGLGKSLRNNWELWDAQNNLCNYFKSKDIRHPDNISSIILISFHRRLHKKDIELDAQIKVYKDLQKEALKKHQKQEQKNRELFNTFSVGDHVEIIFSEVYTKDGGKLSYLGKFYDKKSFRNCSSTGIIISKKDTVINYKNKYLVSVKLDYICEYKKVEISGNLFQKGDILEDYDVIRYNIKKITRSEQN